MRTRTIGAAILAAYLGTIVAANWAVSRWGVVPVGFGLSAPAGVFFVGLAFTLRDLAQNRFRPRRWPILAAIAAGALIDVLARLEVRQGRFDAVAMSGATP